MKKLYVYADFDWLKAIELVGELNCETVRGSNSYSFIFSKDWLKKYASVFLSDDLNNYPGLQFTQPGKDIFGCFSDALPDRWGRTLLDRREQIAAADEKRPVRQLSSFDYLLGIDDFSRMGGFRFKESPDGEFINSDNKLAVPLLSDIQELMMASEEIEKSEEDNKLPDKKWIIQLWHPGSSLGGARPKASVTDHNHNLFIAKFPSRKDNYDVALWEHFSHLLAVKAGINAASTRVISSTSGTYHTIVSRRFDRAKNGRRIHFASALSLLGLKDGDNASNGHGYLDIVGFILQGCTNVNYNLEELYRRVAFNICIGNSDDHFRNHGFLLTPKGWTLSPAYDLNPSIYAYQSLLISKDSSESDLKVLSDACEDYMITRDDAARIISEVVAAVKTWRVLASRLGIPKRDIDRFASIFDGRLPK
ncbi:MAG: type II toxin-antitoxin system HipA family toxin [Bacteroidales bacterium]|jgi:serine/threonine-protein kinase HipA|nr:type II toxin-antitoxin system HipA family toxin [Bacteroidales bacterium]